MSFEAMKRAMEIKCSSATEKAILLVLAEHADEDGGCWPSQARIAERACASDRTVRTVLAAFEKRGLIKREEHRRSDGSRAADRLKLLFLQQPENASGGAENASGTPRKMLPVPPENASGHEPIIEPISKNLSQVASELGDELWSIWPRAGRKRSQSKDVVKRAARAALNRGADPDQIRRGARAYLRDPDTTKQDYQFCKGIQYWLKASAWEAALDAGDQQAPVSMEVWERRVRTFAATGRWPDDAGPKPGLPGCKAPDEIQARHGYTPRPFSRSRVEAA